MTSRILVVGGQSRAAMAFRRHAVQNGRFETRVLVRKPDTAQANETVFTVEDYFAPPAGAFSSIDHVINFTGIAKGPHDKLDAVNGEGPVRLAMAARDAKIGHFIHLSSLSVYGLADSIGRNTPEFPKTAYGRSKARGDAGLAALATPDFAVTILRIPTLYGRGIPSKLRLLAAVVGRLGIFPVSSPANVRSTLHVRNLAFAIERVLESRAAGIRFAADPEPYTNDMLAEVICERKRPVKVIHVPPLLFAPLRTLAPGLYASLYGRSLIAAGELIQGSPTHTLSTREGLADLLD